MKTKVLGFPLLRASTLIRGWFPMPFILDRIFIAFSISFPFSVFSPAPVRGAPPRNPRGCGRESLSLFRSRPGQAAVLRCGPAAPPSLHAVSWRNRQHGCGVILIAFASSGHLPFCTADLVAPALALIRSFGMRSNAKEAYIILRQTGGRHCFQDLFRSPLLDINTTHSTVLPLSHKT